MFVGGGCGGGGHLVVVVVVVFTVVSYPVSCQTSHIGLFHLYKSCRSSVRLPHLVVNESMWLRGTKENVTLTAIENTSDPCVLPPHITHRVTVDLYIEIHVEGVAGEEGRVCTFPRRAIFEHRQGVLKVSCLQERSQAEEEMLESESEASPSSTVSPLRPRNRSLDLPSKDIIGHNSTTRPPQTSPHEPLTPAPSTPNPAMTETETETEHSETTETEPETTPTTSDTPLNTTTNAETTMILDTSSEKMTLSKTTTKTEVTTPKILFSKIMKKTNAAGTQKPSLATEQSIYLAGGGAGVLALVLAVVVIASVAHHRRRQQAKEKESTDLFISGAYRGSMNSLNHSGSQGAYLNAHEMYSGAEPEFVESFELEERVLSTGISYSSHDIPKCLRSDDV